MADDLVQESVNEDAWAKPGPWPVVANKVVLEHSYTHPFTYCLWRILLCNGAWSSCIRDWSTKQKIFTFWPFMEKVGEGEEENCGLKKRKIRQEKASTRFKLLGFHPGSIMS